MLSGMFNTIKQKSEYPSQNLAAIHREAKVKKKKLMML